MLLTIGIPFYNAEKTLTDAIKSVFAQTFQDWELILVDDGSKDRSLGIARSINDPRVQVVSDGVNKGLVYRLNQIASLARGKYLARMDADDLMHPQRLLMQVQYLEDHPLVDVVGAAAYIIDESNNITGTRGANDNTNPFAILSKGMFIHPTITGRSEWFLKNPYDGDYLRAEDRELWCRTYAESQFQQIAQPLLFYRDGYSMVININNYLASCDTQYKIYRRYGPDLIGAPKTIFLIMTTFFKSWLYRGGAIFRKQHILSRHRNRSISKWEASQAAQVVREILNTSLPGDMVKF